MNLKTKIEQVLKSAGVSYRFIPLPENLPPDIASHMAFHKDTLEHAMATIVYKTEKGLIAAIKRADTQIDEKKLKRLVGVSQLLFATYEDLSSIGTNENLVPYVGLEIPYFVDQKILNVGKVYGTPGAKTLGMVMDARDMVKINGGKVGDFTNFEKSKTMLESGRQRIVSGITPSGDGTLHIGNYLGAVKQFIEIAKSNDCFLFVADYHALTTIQDKKQLQNNVELLILNELALLGDMTNITFYRQSDIRLHGELQTIINNVTPLGLLKRAHAYKDKLQKEVSEDEINLGLFNYPILMAADILMYKPDLVPVGKDQKQHVEITRDIAERFNRVYGGERGKKGDRGKGIFKLPEAYIPEEVAAVIGTDGKRKMSKSLGNIISIFEDEEIIRKQVNSTFTDPTRKHATDPGHIEGNMVFTYLDFFGDPERVALLKEKYREGKVADAAVKEYLFESLIKMFAPARMRYQELKNSPQKVKDILETGSAKARAVANETMREVREAVGLTNKYLFFGYQTINNAPQPPLTKRGRGGVVNQSDDNQITIDDFARVEERVGKVIEAKNVPGSEKLIRLVVDFGEQGRRIIFTGVRGFGYTPPDFAGKQFLFVVNLTPRKMPSFVKTSEGILQEESQGMILAVDGTDRKPQFISAEGMPIGAKIR